MAAYKDEERGTWYVSFYYNDWTGGTKAKSQARIPDQKRSNKFRNGIH